MVENAPAAELVQRDMPCFRCGYNLRNLPVAGQCPECGEVVAISQPGRHLAVADAHWRGGVRLGAVLHAAGLGAVLIVVFDLLVRDRLPDPLVFYPLLMGAVTVGAVGAWLAAKPEPGGPYYDDGPWLRRILQGLACLVWLAMVGYTGIQVAEQVHGQSFQNIGLWQTITGIPAFGGSLLVSALLMWHLSRLAKRLDNRRLVLWGRLSAFSTPITVATIYAMAFLFVRIRVPNRFAVVLAVTIYTAPLLWPAMYAVIWRRCAGKAPRG